MHAERHSGQAASAVMAMVAQVERQGDGLTTRYAGGEGISGQFRDFQGFVEQLDQYQLFIDMVESRLDGFAPAARAAQAKHLVELRWTMMQMEIEATSLFLQRMASSHAPWPMGSQPFLRRRLARLDEIAAFHAAQESGYQLVAPDAALMQKIRSQVGSQIGRSLALNDFSIPDRAPSPGPAVSPAPAAVPVPRRMPAKPAAPPSPPKRVLELLTREAEGYYYISNDGVGVISDACRVNHSSLDDLAKDLELSRPGLVLILNGRDPVNPALLKTLRRFVMRAGGRPI